LLWVFMKIRVKWTKKAEQHIARHGLSRSQVNQALKGKKFVKRTTHNRYLILCSYYGRILAVIAEPYKDMFYMKGITARDANDKEKRLYKKKVK